MNLSAEELDRQADEAARDGEYERAEQLRRAARQLREGESE